MYRFLLRNIIAPVFDFATGNDTRKYLKELQKSQWFSPAELRKLQEIKLRLLIRHAYETVPYYHNVFRVRDLKPDDIKSVSDLTKLPVISRAEVREQFENLVSTGYPKGKAILGRTGGSTGEPIRFYTTRENRAWSTAARYLAWQWAGFELGDKFAQVFGSPLDQPALKSLRTRMEGRLKRRIFLDAYQMSEEKLMMFANRMKNFKPDFIYGFAEAVAVLARYIEEKGVNGIHLKSAIVDSSRLFEHEVNTIERVFGCKVWWNYHNRENGTFASECSEHDGYHLFAQNSVFEFIMDGEQVTSGEQGAIVITDLNNYAMPFLRYEVGDVGIPSDEPCACGRPLPKMKKLFGRTREVLVSSTGKFVDDVFYLFLERFFETRKIKKYQIVQESPTQLVVNIVPDRNYAEEDTGFLKKAILSIMGEMEIDIRLVEPEILDGPGKRQVLLRKFPIKFT